jgi:hypothetical protein
MKPLIVAAVLLASAAPAEAGPRACAKRVREILQDKTTGFTLKFVTSDGNGFLLSMDHQNATERQKDLIEEMQDCMAIARGRGASFMLYATDTKKFISFVRASLDWQITVLPDEMVSQKMKDLVKGGAR